MKNNDTFLRIYSSFLLVPLSRLRHISAYSRYFLLASIVAFVIQGMYGIAAFWSGYNFFSSVPDEFDSRAEFSVALFVS